jgi:long-chain acyl-CoA synthetase
MPGTLIRYFQNFDRRGSEVAYVQRRGCRTVLWTYRETVEQGRRFACELRARGIGRGEKVVLWGEDSVEWIVAFIGCVLRGAVVVPLDRIGTAEFAERVIRQVGARLVVCSRGLAATGDAPVLTLEDLIPSLAEHPPTYVPDDLTAEDTVEIVFTSGTTADPKGVVIAHSNILANLEPLETEIGKYLKYERVFHPLRFLNLLPLSHVFGQFLGLFIPQLLGAAVVLQDTLNPADIIRTIRRERVSVLVAVPRLLDSLKDKIERDCEAAGTLAKFRKQFEDSQKEHFLRRWWRFRRIHSEFGWKFWAFISGGAALDSETERFWGRLGFAVIQGYGMTETTSLVSVNHPMKLGRGSIGKALPGLEIKLAADGEILVRGKNVASGYLQGNELKPVLGNQEWFHTGDIGQLDAAGNLYFKGRQKEVIVTPEGMNVYPQDLEASLRAEPHIRDCVVFGLERESNAEPAAVLRLSDPSLDAEPVVRRANARLAAFQQIRHWYVWPEEDFPRTSTQKPRISVIRQAAEEHLKGGKTGSQSGGGIADIIARVTGRRAAEVSPETRLATDLNLSSMDRVELLGALEDRYQVDLNESKFTSAITVGELERMLHAPVARRTDYTYPRWTQSTPVAALRFVFYYLVTWPLMALMSFPKVEGRENLRQARGPLLFVANHVTQVDVVFVLAALPMRYRHRLAVAMLGELLEAMRKPPAGAGVWRRWIDKVSYALVVSLFNVFPLPQHTGFRQSFVFAGESADRGYSILVFPEGVRTQDGRMAPFQAGVGLLTRDLNLPVVPLRIDGLFELKKNRRKIARPGSVRVQIGQPVRFGREADPQAVARDLERRMAELGQSSL